MDTIEDLEARAQARMNDYATTGWYMDRISLTPDRLIAVENHNRAVFATEAEAKRANRRNDVRVLTLLFCAFPAILAGVGAGDAVHWAVGLITFVAVVAGLNRTATVATRFLEAPSYSVSTAMVPAWTEARRVLETMNEENTVPQVLAKVQELEAEARTIYTTYSVLVSPVDREQAELDFLTVCALIEVLGEEAAARRNELYSTRRRQLLA